MSRRGLPLPFASKVLLVTLAVAGVSFLLLARIVLREAHLHLDRQLGDTLSGHAAALAALLSPAELNLVDEGDGAESAVVRRIRARLDAVRRGAHLRGASVLDRDLRTVVSLRDGSSRGEEDPFAALDPGEISRALGGRRTATALYRDASGRWCKTGYAPVRGGDGTTAYVVGVEGEANMFRTLEALRRKLILASALLLSGVILAAWLAARSVARPLARLADAAERAAGGDLAVRVEATTNDEAGRLAEILARLLAAVRDREGLLRRDLIFARERSDEVARAPDLLAAAMPLGLAIFDARLLLTSVNRRLGEMLGLDLAERIGRPLAEVFAPHPPLAALAPPAPGSPPPPARVELTRDGARAILVPVFVPLADGEGAPRGHLLLLSDVTREIELEELAGRRARLETVAALSAAIAHEVRNPLGGIRGFAELTRRAATDPAKVDEYAAEILREVAAIDALVADFLTFARPAPARLEPVEFAPLAERARFGLEEEMARRGISFGTEFAPDLIVTADAEQLRRVLHNLLRNALDALPDGGRITLHAGRDETSHLARIVVADDGPGIAPEIRAHLFEPFVTGKASGTGLGLAIVARHVEAHGGRVEVDRADGATRFTVLLPLGAPEPKGRN